MKSKLSEQEIDYTIENVAASFSFEGMEVTVDEKNDVREILRGNLSIADYIKKVKEEYMVNG